MANFHHSSLPFVVGQVHLLLLLLIIIIISTMMSCGVQGHYVSLVHPRNETHCRLLDGKLINNSKSQPRRLMVDAFTCLECYCNSADAGGDAVGDGDGDGDGDDDGSGGPLPQATCVGYHCPDPGCVNPVQSAHHCCPVCTRGPNCYVPRDVTLGDDGAREIIPAGWDVVVKTHRKLKWICRCAAHDAEGYEKVAVCQTLKCRNKKQKKRKNKNKNKNENKNEKKKKSKKNKDKKNKNKNKEIKKNKRNKDKKRPATPSPNEGGPK